MMRTAAESDLPPLEKLDGIVDVTVAFVRARPEFRELLRHVAGGGIVGPVLIEHAGGGRGQFRDAMALLAGIVADRQTEGEIRDGDASAIAHLYVVKTLFGGHFREAC
jgi:hypothetical protein